MSELSKLEIHPPISNNLLPEKSEMSVHLDNGIGSMSEVEELKQGFNNVGRERSFSGNVNNLKSTDSLAKRQSFKEKVSEQSKDRTKHNMIPALPLTEIQKALYPTISDAQEAQEGGFVGAI